MKTNSPFRCKMLLQMFFFFNDTATTEIYTLSLHDALPISRGSAVLRDGRTARAHDRRRGGLRAGALVPGWCAGHDAVFAGSSGAARPVVWSHGWVGAAGHDRGLRAAVARGSVAPRELRFRGHDRVPALRVRH